ncbi:hypothetical protein WR25_01764 [Diploscapter pachys]|uniref:Uncharacterized protein n=1 Tax=Diploscapter pachys TaxID=2018661 RepID=A0A2A2JIE5_9BILA|nr:hypothetical protein WR25_01764 [Diploscapter pachys]
MRIETKLTTDKSFYERWMSLITLQNSQLEEQSNDYPLDYILEDAKKCWRPLVLPAEDTNLLRPDDISVYAEMGHLSIYCPSNFTLLKNGILHPCTRKSSTTELPTLDKLIKIYNENLTVIDSNEWNDSLIEQARSIASSIREYSNYNEMWKIIFIMASVQDGEGSETGQVAVEVLETIQEIHRLLPHRTFVVALRTSGNGIWRDASHTHQACRDQLSVYKGHQRYNHESVWEQVEKIVGHNFQKHNFTVEILPLLKDPALGNLPDETDLSPLGYDCAHFSERGLSLLHLAIWNSILTRSRERSEQFRPVTTQVACPDPRCPFIRTQENSVMCIWRENIDSNAPPMAPRLIVMGVLLLTILLSLLVLICVCRQRRASGFKKQIKPFGASFSSIKFIDEDVI